MRIKDNKAFEIVSELLCEKQEVLSEAIITYLTDQKLISEDCNNGWLILDVLSGRGSFDVRLNDIIRVVSAHVRINNPSVFLKLIKNTREKFNELKANMLELVIMGDGDCPFCGGETEFFDGEKKDIGGDGYVTPKEYKWISRMDKCTDCGQLIIIEPEKDID